MARRSRRSDQSHELSLPLRRTPPCEKAGAVICFVSVQYSSVFWLQDIKSMYRPSVLSKQPSRLGRPCQVFYNQVSLVVEQITFPDKIDLAWLNTCMFLVLVWGRVLLHQAAGGCFQPTPDKQYCSKQRFLWRSALSWWHRDHSPVRHRSYAPRWTRVDSGVVKVQTPTWSWISGIRPEMQTRLHK